MLDQSHLYQYFQLTPGLHEILMDIGLGIRAPRRHVTTGSMVIGKGPVDEVQIQVIEL